MSTDDMIIYVENHIDSKHTQNHQKKKLVELISKFSKVDYVGDTGDCHQGHPQLVL